MRDESPKTSAYLILTNAKDRIQDLPRFSGQSQLVASLKRILDMALWKK